jgi:hypothetical protein
MSSYPLVEDSESILTDFHLHSQAFEMLLRDRGSSRAQLVYKISDSGIITISDAKQDILTAKAEVIGITGVSLESEVSLESVDSNEISYIKWIWTVIDCDITRKFQERLAADNDLVLYTKFPIMYFKDSMMVSYLLALIRYNLEFELLTTFSTVDGEFVCIGMTDISYVSVARTESGPLT